MILSVLLNNHFGFSIKKRLERGKSGSVETRWGGHSNYPRAKPPGLRLRWPC